MAARIVSDEDIHVIELNCSEVIEEFLLLDVRYLHVDNDSSLNCPAATAFWKKFCTTMNI